MELGARIRRNLDPVYGVEATKGRRGRTCGGPEKEAIQ